MARVSEIMAKQLPQQQMLAVRKTIDFFKDYSDFMGSALGGILPLIEQNGALPGSGPVVCFHNTELAALDVEIGFLLPWAVDGQGDIRAVTLPVRTVAVTIDRGPYEQQDPTLEALMKWIPEHGYKAAGGIYYHYLNGEDQPESEYLTEMSIPIEPSAD